MNININAFYCYVKKEHFFDYEIGFEEFEYCYVFGARSVPSRAATLQGSFFQNLFCELKH